MLNYFWQNGSRSSTPSKVGRTDRCLKCQAQEEELKSVRNSLEKAQAELDPAQRHRTAVSTFELHADPPAQGVRLADDLEQLLREVHAAVLRPQPPAANCGECPQLAQQLAEATDRAAQLESRLQQSTDQGSLLFQKVQELEMYLRGLNGHNEQFYKEQAESLEKTIKYKD
jgi:hypothetical protein